MVNDPTKMALFLGGKRGMAVGWAPEIPMKQYLLGTKARSGDGWSSSWCEARRGASWTRLGKVGQVTGYVYKFIYIYIQPEIFI